MFYNCSFLYVSNVAKTILFVLVSNIQSLYEYIFIVRLFIVRGCPNVYIKTRDAWNNYREIKLLFIIRSAFLSFLILCVSRASEHENCKIQSDVWQGNMKLEKRAGQLPVMKNIFLSVSCFESKFWLKDYMEHSPFNSVKM